MYWFLLLTIFHFCNCTSCPSSSLPRPEVKLKVSSRESDGNGDVDFQNETTLIVSNNYAKVDLICKAAYPIEWIVHYHEDDDGGGMIKNAFVNRNFRNYFDKSSYEYTATLKFYAERVCNSVKFSCQSTLEPRKECWSTAVITEIPKNSRFVRNILIFTVKENAYLQYSTPSNLPCIGIAFYYNLTVDSAPDPCWECYRNVDDGNTELELITEDFHSCFTAMHCKNHFGAANRGTRCLKLEHHNFTEDESFDFYDAKNCKGDNQKAKLYGGRFITCKYFGLLLAQHFIVTWPKDGKIQTYFHWSDIDPKTMIDINIDRSAVYVGEEFLVQCTFSRYYFSYGCQLGVQFANGTLQLFTYMALANETKYSMTLSGKILATTSMIESVYCIGAVWNTSDWSNTSSSLFVRNDTLKPFIAETSNTISVEYYLGDTNKSLRCKGEGRPLPKLNWLSSPLNNPDVHYNISGRYIEIRFQEISHSHKGTYTCEAVNVLGNYTQTYEVIIHDPNHRTVGIVVGLFVATVIIFLVIGLLLWKKIKFQADILRNLTEDEVTEFLEGNKGHAFVIGNDYLNTPDKISSLEYNQVYEIPRHKLKFEENHKLGEGAYGLVYKGFLKSDDNSNIFSDLVAIKTVSSTVGVEHFKTLLSEIKILAYIGEHKNIVSLVGACTENIKNREVLIALEFCSKGDLLDFLSSSRKTFQNLFSDLKIHEYENIDDESEAVHNTTTKDLLKWTINIADGLEYLAEKKVIHGDVAAINVLLNEYLVAKVSDFGLSRQMLEFSNYVKTTKMPLPFKWMALESLKYLEFSTQSDVWAFGVTMWEIFSLGEVPFAGCNYSTDFIEQLSGGMRMGKPKPCPDDIYLYMQNTWNTSAKERPLYSEIKSICQNHLKELGETIRECAHCEIMDEVGLEEEESDEVCVGPI